MSALPATQLVAEHLSGSHIGRTVTLRFGPARHPKSLVRGRLEEVKHRASYDDIEVTVMVAGQPVVLDVPPGEAIELE